MKRHSKIIIIGIAISLAIVTWLVVDMWLENSKAEAYPSPYVLGGKVLVRINCNCSSGYVIYVSPPRPGAFWVGPGTTVYEYGGISVGEWVLGDWGPPPGACFITCGNSCCWVPNMGTVGIIGSSQ